MYSHRLCEVTLPGNLVILASTCTMPTSKIIWVTIKIYSYIFTYRPPKTNYEDAAFPISGSMVVDKSYI